MAESERSSVEEAPQVQEEKPEEEVRNDDLEEEGEEELGGNDGIEGVHDEGDEKEEEASQLGESQQLLKSPSSRQEVEGEEEEEEEDGEGELREEQLETLVTPSAVVSENDHSQGLQENLALETHVDAEFKEEGGISNLEVQGTEGQTRNQPQTSVCPTSLLELSPTSVTQSISSAPSPTIPEQRLSPGNINSSCMSETDRCSASEFRTLNVKTSIPDGYNWRKYGQKQVKSPKGSRSYYKCTHYDCFAKKIECSDHSGHVIEVVNKGVHSHDPPRKNSCRRESRVTLSAGAVLANSATEHDIKLIKDSDVPSLPKEPGPEMPTIPERKRQNSISSDGNGEIQIKQERVGEPEPKRRQKTGELQCLKAPAKPGKKPKVVVHAAGDVGISADGYRWRKYGQKMVKGNSHPRNYYRCTSAGCPVRKHIETAVDNMSAVIITYKGVHDHDMPVPKKRHGPPSAPLVAAAAPASLNNLQLKKTDTFQIQPTSTQWSVGKEGELTSETVELGGEKEKAIESARTLLSIGFEIKPC